MRPSNTSPRPHLAAPTAGAPSGGCGGKARAATPPPLANLGPNYGGFDLRPLKIPRNPALNRTGPSYLSDSCWPTGPTLGYLQVLELSRDGICLFLFISNFLRNKRLAFLIINLPLEVRYRKFSIRRNNTPHSYSCFESGAQTSIVPRWDSRRPQHNAGVPGMPSDGRGDVM